ncbi:globoside alpha-1,3-N-acetylgalactosaminyltransferase 1-like [Aplochiton taeniatus]
MFLRKFNSKPCYLVLLVAVVIGMISYLYFSETYSRMDVVTVAPWLAPVVWEGTFNADLLDSAYKPLNITIATTVFAVGKYTRFLKDFLETAEQHYFVGYQVNFYIFTDRPKEVPSVKMAADRQVVVLPVPSSNRWQDISARRMEIIQKAIEERLGHHADYIFCLDVDSKFHAHWGAETLGALVAVVHPGYWNVGRDGFPYERRLVSRAYIPADEGDFYYCGGAFGGRLDAVHAMAKTCRQRFEEDAAEGVEAAWQEESHLNRYLVSHKPTKLLSPEYLWQDFAPVPHQVKAIRFSGVIKNYAEIRPNV